ncbi:MAG TPA: hypothetical protein VL947_01820, partial [Cytophagales bacterium]|nr:hypothetical protein [Cytophagales bacterium]
MAHNENCQKLASSDRILLIDSLRGYALMGLFMVHMVEYFELYWYHPVESPFKDFIFAVFGGKAYAMFALLFGLSFSMISDRKDQQGLSYTSILFRRFFILLFFGILHGLIYGGDILIILAVTGLLILPLHRAPNFIPLGMAILLLLQVPWLVYAGFYTIQGKTNYAQPMHWSLYESVFHVYARGSLKDLLEVNMTKAALSKWSFMFESGRLSTI